MIRIRALNEVCDNEEDNLGDNARKPTREAQEQEAIEIYNHTFQLVADGRFDVAIDALEMILELPFLEEDNLKKCSPKQLQIKLGCLKTLSSIHYSLKPDPEAAVRVMKKAIALDPNNVTLWYRLGISASKILDYELAFAAFAQGYECSSNHWGCLENLITLAYVLFDSTACLRYCAIGLAKDPSFIRGLVFRDHIFRIQPSMKSENKESIPDWEALNVNTPYAKDWEDKFLIEVDTLLRAQREEAEKIFEEEIVQNSEIIVSEQSLNSFTWAELSRIVILLYQQAKKVRGLLRPVQLIREVSDPVSAVETTGALGDDEHGNPVLALETDLYNRRSSVEEIKLNDLENESGSDVLGDTVVENGYGDKSPDSPSNEATEKEDDELKDRSKKKAKRDVKWWQFEGKRRSERVRGNLAIPVQAHVTKKTDFITKLKNVIPISLLTMEDADDEDKDTMGKTPDDSESTVGENGYKYFGTEDEVANVKKFITEQRNSSTLDLLTELTRVLAKKTDKRWPSELIDKYILLYSLYRNHVPHPDAFTTVDFVHRSLEIECRVTLSMLELWAETSSSISMLKDDEKFNLSLFFVSETCRVIESQILEIRLDWLRAKYNLSLAQSGDPTFEKARFYLEEIQRKLSDELTIQTHTRVDSLITLEEVTKKLNFLQRMESVNRVTELYEANNYAELIEILPFCYKSDSSKGIDLMNRIYLADSYFQLQHYAECHSECLKVIKHCKVRTNEPILPKIIIMLKRVVCVPEYKMSIRLIRETVKGMMALLVSEQKYPIPASVLISPWCVLHAVLYKWEQYNPDLHLEEESTPNSILVLQFAHEQMVYGGKCTLNKGKLLTYTLDSLLPLVSCEPYSEHEELRHSIEQAVFCLYGYPTRLSKVKYLTDHRNSTITLDLNRSHQLYEYYRPENLPEFDSYNSISSDEAGLFTRILELIPPDQKPESTFNKLKEFLDGDVEEFDEEKENFFDPKFRDIFYLLGDHHFKVKEWTKSTEFYTWDLSLSPVRFDSWAAIALAKAERVNTRLNSCDNFNITEIMSRANVAVKCFQNALELDPSSSKLRIEFGSFLYSMHSFCSRLMKQNADQLSLDHFDLVEAKKEEFLARSARCFEPSVANVRTNGEDKEVNEQHEEIWIHHYMLGKVMEKLDPHTPVPFLEQYELAGKLLDEHGAVYPMKINFYSPQELAIEALEIFYRIHVSVLNYMEKHDFSAEIEKILLQFVERASESPFMKSRVKRPDSGTESKRKKHERTVANVKGLMEEMLSKVEEMVIEEADVEVSSKSTTSSSLSSDEDSSDSSSDEELKEESKPPAQPISFGLSVFQEKLREKEMREVKLAEAKLAEERRKSLLPLNESNCTENGEAPLLAQKLSPMSIEDQFPEFKSIKGGRILAHCVKAMQECIYRFPAHHKSYFRIAYTYSTFCKEHLKVSRDWLLGTGTLTKKRIIGLFGDRKPSNFFNGIWRNPIDDIDRPGSFPYHMSKTIQILLEILNGLNDHEMLAEIGIQLAKVPDSDKKYLYDFEREQFSQQAITSAVAAAKRLLNNCGNNSQDVALGIYTSYLKIQKSNLKENGIGPILVEAYKRHLRSKGMIPDGLTVESAFKHYQHLIWTSKLKASQRSKVTIGAGKDGGLGNASSIKSIKRIGHKSISDLQFKSVPSKSLATLGAGAIDSRSTILNSYFNLTSGLEPQEQGPLANQTRNQQQLKPLGLLETSTATSILNELMQNQAFKNQSMYKAIRPAGLPDSSDRSKISNGHPMHNELSGSQQMRKQKSMKKSPPVSTLSDVPAENVPKLLNGRPMPKLLSIPTTEGYLPGLTLYQGLQATPIFPSADLSQLAQRARKVAKRKPSVTPVIPRTPPVSIPLSTISTFNTSPFKTQSTMISNPGHFILGLPDRPTTPPAAHSSNKTPPYAGNDGGPEIIDLTTKSPIKVAPEIISFIINNHPENGNGRGIKRPLPQIIAITPPNENGPESILGYSLPPKKKFAMRRVTVDPLTLASVPRTNIKPTEVITID